MLIAGAKGHAKEVLEILHLHGEKNICFFDDVHPELTKVYQQFDVLKSEAAAMAYLKAAPEYVIGVGGPKVRELLHQKLEAMGGELVTLVAENALVGHFEVRLGTGCLLMQKVFISNSVEIGKAALINTAAHIHHDCRIGAYSEIGPGSIVCGNVEVGPYAQIGAGARLIPGVRIGAYARVGAGAVVIQDVADHQTVVGVPAKNVTK